MTEELARRIDEIEDEIAELKREHAITRESVRIYTDMIQDFRTGLDEVRKMLVEHVHQEARDRVKLLAGIVTSALAGLSTLGVLIWGVFELLQKSQ